MVYHQCEFCDKVFERKSHYISHRRMHTGEKPFTCLLCGKAFSMKHQLPPHMRIHTGEKPHTCEVCNATFTQKGQLDRHTLRHTGEKPFSCEVCGRGFSEKGSMRRHMQIHTGDRPQHECDVCLRRFAERNNLRRHYTSKHTSLFAETDQNTVTTKATRAQSRKNTETGDPCETNSTTNENPENSPIGEELDEVFTTLLSETAAKTHACDICVMIFVDKRSYKRHMAKHVKGKIHSCRICEESFSDQSILEQHMQIHTWENVQQI